MRASRVRADRVRVGDEILSPYYPRRWQVVEAVLRDGPRPIGLDTPRDRTWWEVEALVPCRTP